MNAKSWVQQTLKEVSLSAPGKLQLRGEQAIKLAGQAAATYVTYSFDEKNASWQLHLVLAESVPAQHRGALFQIVKESAVSGLGCHLASKPAAANVRVGKCKKRGVDSNIWVRFLNRGGRIAFFIVQSSQASPRISADAIRFVQSGRWKAGAEEAPTGSQQAFAKWVVARGKTIAPGLVFSISDPMTIKFHQRNDEQRGGQMNLDRTWNLCSSNNSSCADEVDRLLRAAGDAVTAKAAQPPKKEKLRVVLRPKNYVNPHKKLLARPLAADLWVFVAEDMPDRIRMLQLSDVKPLGLDAQQAEAVALANTVKELGKLGTKKLPKQGVGVLESKSATYVTAWLVNHKAWENYAKQTRGGLLVVAPSTEVILYADAAAPGIHTILQTLAKRFNRSAERPLSTSILQWSSQGWRVLGLRSK